MLKQNSIIYMYEDLFTISEISDDCKTLFLQHEDPSSVFPVVGITVETFIKDATIIGEL